MNKMIGLCLLSVFLSGSLYTTSEWRFLQPFLFLTGTLIIICYAVLIKLRAIKLDIGIHITFMLFVFFSLVSSMLIADSGLFIESLVWLYIYITLTIVLNSLIINKDTGFKIIIFGFLLANLPLLITPILWGNISYQSYSGIFYNPNSLGTIAVTTLTISLSLFIFYMECYIKGKRIQKLGLILTFFINGFLILITVFSSSRTSLLAMTAMLIMSSVLLVTKVKVNQKVEVKRVKKVTIITLNAILVTLALYIFTPFSDILHESIVDKFEQKSENITGGRIDTWITVIKNANWFGHGEQYFDIIGSGSHNTFISLLGQFGIITLLFFIAFLIQIFIKSIRFLKFNSKYKYLPLFSLTLFVILSMGESMLYKPSMFLIFSLLGFLNYRQEKLHAKSIK